MNNARIFEAIEFATRAHTGQYRKASRLPYIYHPTSVARILIECDASEEAIIAGLLHDVIEDTKVTLNELRSQFGDSVADLVNALSEPDRSAPWETRKRDNLALLETASQDVLLVELADKLDNIRDIQHNLQSIGDVTWQRFNRGRDQQKWIYQQLAEVFSRRLETDCGRVLAREFQERVRAVFGE
jgi:(p)ppGpp synthase/HD superfamily hydrolase